MKPNQWIKLIDEENIKDNRTRRHKNKVRREEKKDDNLEKIDLRKIYSQFLEEKQSKRGECNKCTPPIISTNCPQLNNDSGLSLIEEDIFSTQDKTFLPVLEEFQNANVSNNIDSTTRHPPASTPPRKKQSPKVLLFPVVCKPWEVSTKHQHFFRIFYIWCNKQGAFRRVFFFRYSHWNMIFLDDISFSRKYDLIL